VLTAHQPQLAVLVAQGLQAHLILSNEAVVVVVVVRHRPPARVAQAVAAQALSTTVITGLMEP
jgi:hypothetical protein